MRLTCRAEQFPLSSPFRIARGAKTSADVVYVEFDKNGIIGRGEAVPYQRYGETLDDTIAAINALPNTFSHEELAALLPAGAARNAVDCAYWDWRAKSQNNSIASLVGLSEIEKTRTAQTLSLDSVEAMVTSALALDEDALIKIKLGAEGDVERLRAIRAARPVAALIVDANEGWDKSFYEAVLPVLVELNIAMIEQPLPSNDDEVLRDLPRPIPICADESCHISADIPKLVGKYDMVNVKLDKTGGLTEALALVDAANAAKLPYMIGCMIATSLAMAPAQLLAANARFVDLDGPLFLAQDREYAIHYDGGWMYPAKRELWG